MDELEHLGPLVVEATGALDAEEAASDQEPRVEGLEQAAAMLTQLWDTFSGLNPSSRTADKYLGVDQGEIRLDSRDQAWVT